MTRRALVLGGSEGIGAAAAQRLDADGFDVTIVARTAERLESTLATLGGGTAFACDLADPDDRRRLGAHLASAGQPHVVVGAVHQRSAWSRVATTDPGAYAAAVDVHLGHLAALAADALPAQRADGYGRWILISSLVASIGGHGQAAYAAQKAAIEAFARTLAVEEGRHGITANVVVPGFVAGESMASRYTPEQLAAFAECSVVGRCGTPEEVGHAVSFLADERAGFVTGVSLPVTGGADLNWWLVPAMQRAGGER